MRGQDASPPTRAPGFIRRVTSRLHTFVHEHTPSRRAERLRMQCEDEEIDEAGRESFPASDPPTWTLGHERRP